MRKAEPEITFHAAPQFTALAVKMHAECFDASWTAEDFTDLFSIKGTVFQLLSLDEEPAAFAVYRSIAGQAEILTIGVRPAYRGRGLAGRLLDSALDFLKRGEVLQLFLEVGENNSPARNLYDSRGFTHHGIRKDYYRHRDGTENAIVMRRLL